MRHPRLAAQVAALAEVLHQRLQPPQRLAVAARDPVPDAPHVLPRDVADPVEPRVLERVVAVLVPPAADGRHPARRQPLEEVDRRRHRRAERVRRPPARLAPSEGRPAEGGDRAAELWLQRDAVALRDALVREGLGDRVQRIAVDAVGVRRAGERHDRGGLLALVPRLGVPRHERPQDAHALIVELPHDVSEARETARHAPDHVIRIAVAPQFSFILSANAELQKRRLCRLRAQQHRPGLARCQLSK